MKGNGRQLSAGGGERHFAVVIEADREGFATHLEPYISHFFLDGIGQGFFILAAGDRRTGPRTGTVAHHVLGQVAQSGFRLGRIQGIEDLTLRFGNLCGRGVDHSGKGQSRKKIQEPLHCKNLLGATGVIKAQGCETLPFLRTGSTRPWPCRFRWRESRTSPDRQRRDRLPFPLPASRSPSR